MLSENISCRLNMPVLFIFLSLFFLHFTTFGQYHPFYSADRAIKEHSFYEQYRNLIAKYNDGVDSEHVVYKMDSLARLSLAYQDGVQYLFLTNEITNLYRHQSEFTLAYDRLLEGMNTYSSSWDTIDMEYFVSLRLLRATLGNLRRIPGNADFPGRSEEELFQAQFYILEQLNNEGEPLRNTLVDYGLALYRQGREQEGNATLYRARTLALPANDLASLALADYSIISRMEGSFDLLKTQNEVLINDIELFESGQASIPTLVYNAFFNTKVSQNFFNYFNDVDQAIYYAEKAAALLDTLRYPTYNIQAATHGNLALYYSEMGDSIKMWEHVARAKQTALEQPMSDYNRAFAIVLIADAVTPFSADSAFAYLDIIEDLPGARFFHDKTTEIRGKVYLHNGMLAQAADLILSLYDEHETLNGLKVPADLYSMDPINQFYFLEILAEAYMKMGDISAPDAAIIRVLSMQNELFQEKMAGDIFGFEATSLVTLYNRFLENALPYVFENGSTQFFDEKMQLALSSKALHLNSLLAKNRFQSALESDTTMFSQLLARSRQVQRSRNQLAAASGSDDERIHSLKMQLNSDLIDYLMFRHEIDENFSNTDLELFREQIQLASWSDIQSQLGDNEALVEYFIFDNAWAKMLFRSDTIITFYRANEDIARTIDRERFAVQTGRQTTGLGEVLFEDLIPYLQDVEKLVIIPDKNLNFIPFEWLTVGGQMLIENYTVSYSYSPLLWHNLRKEHVDSPPRTMLAIAPVFEDPLRTTEPQFASHYRGEESLDYLPFSMDEIIGIETIMRDRMHKINHLKKEDASLSNVRNLISQYDIVHFATHGLVNSDHPERSGLFLYQVNDPDNNEPGFLSMGELFEMDFNAGLMVLSACNTGRGSFMEGEGVIALPRGFILSGVPRVLATLWRVHDEKTRDMMLMFYRHVANGKDYPEALRLAKLEARDNGFLPLDWAGFVLIGH